MKFSLSFLFFVSLLVAGNQAIAQTTAPAVADSALLKAYTGSYSFESGSPVQKFVVTVEKGDLYGEADSYGKNKLLKQTKADTYQSTSSYGSIITFVRDAATQVITGLTLAAQGSEISAKKDKP